MFAVVTYTVFVVSHEIHHFGHVVFLYSGRKRGVDTLPPFRQGAFWSPKRVLGPKNPIFELFRIFRAQKCTFGVILRPGSKGLLNKGVQEPFFSLWEPKTENELILALLAPKVQHDSFFAFCRPKLKNEPIFGFWRQKCGKGATKPFVS